MLVESKAPFTTCYISVKFHSTIPVIDVPGIVLTYIGLLLALISASFRFHTHININEVIAASSKKYKIACNFKLGQ